MIPDNNGKIEVFKRFCRYDEENENAVSLLLAHIDLTNANDRRRIFTEHILMKLMKSIKGI